MVPLDQADVVILSSSRYQLPNIVPQAYISELAFAHELAACNCAFTVTDSVHDVFDKAIVWFIPNDGRDFVYPRLWDYSEQVRAFAEGMERQGNRPFCSAHETQFWENKSHMHRCLEAVGAPTPTTIALTSENWQTVDFDLAPVLIKEEHSSASQGIHHFVTSAEAREFVRNYQFRPGETLMMQAIVGGSTKDLRLTMVGDRMIEEATYWRIKSSEALASSHWTTTATSYGSIVEHAGIPELIVPRAADLLAKLRIRTAGIDLIWESDDVEREPLYLELSPYYQPNPPKPARYANWSYKQYKQKRRNIKQGYLLQQYWVFRKIAAEVLSQDLL